MFKNKKVYEKESAISGHGLFASKPLKKGETIFVVKGNIIKFFRDTFNHLGGENWLGIGDYMWIAAAHDQPLKFLNHSCKPNAGIKGRVTIVALKDIAKDEEITLDYSITEIDEQWHMGCMCGNDNCRKTIRSIQSLPEKVYSDYLPFIPTYFKKKYADSKKTK